MSYATDRGRRTQRKELRRRLREIAVARAARRKRRRARARKRDVKSFRSMVKRSTTTMRTMMVETFVEDVVAGELHAAQVKSIVGGVQGVLEAASMSVSAIGKGYAAFNDGDAKHGIKQVDRMLSNAKLDMDGFFAQWIPFVVGEQTEITVALDWTEFDADGHSTLAATVVEGASDGRSRLLIWETFAADELGDGGRTDAEDTLLLALHAHMPEGVRIVLMADRGFGDSALYTLLSSWGWDYVIRFRGCIEVTDGAGTSQPASAWLHRTGRARKLDGASVTKERVPVGAVVVVHDTKMKDPWFLATSLRGETASQVVKRYGKRFTIEETFRDLKDPRYGLGMRACRIRRVDRRDRLLLLFAITHAMLSMLGEASEKIGYDRRLRANTAKKRTHSLFTQGAYYFGAMPNMSDARLWPLIEAFVDILHRHQVFRSLTSAAAARRRAKK